MSLAESLFSIFSPEDDGQPGKQNTLRQFCQRAFFPYLARERERPARPGTLRAYQETLAWWEAIVPRNPPIAAIGKEDLLILREGLLAANGKKWARLAKHTVRKHCGNVARMLAFAGPAGLGVLEKVPAVPLPAVPRARPWGVMTLDELSRTIAAARTLTSWDLRRGRRGRPRPAAPHFTPGQFIAAYLATIYVTGYRRGRLTELVWGQYRDGWLRLRPPGERPAEEEATHKLANDAFVPAWARAFIEALRPGFHHGGTEDTERIFCWPYSDWSSLNKAIERAQVAAGIPIERRKFLKGHAGRKLHGTQLGLDDPRLAQLSLGHTTWSTSAGHYVEAAELVRAAVERLPAVEAHHPDAEQTEKGDRQRLLFE